MSFEGHNRGLCVKCGKIHKSNKGKQYVPREIRVCQCGCNQTFECKVNSDQKYIWGHNSRGRVCSELYKKRVGESNKISVKKYYEGHVSFLKGRIKVPRETRYCQCRCGETFECKVNSKQRFIKGHGSKGLTKEISEVIRLREEKRKETMLRIYGFSNPGLIKENRLKASQRLTNRTYEQIYGLEKAVEILDKKKVAMLGKNTGEKNWNFGRRGSAHPAWKGGLSFEPYGIEFNDELKERVKERDGYRCVVCDKGNVILCVHHINYDKRDNSGLNLVTLCNSCHLKTNSNRNAWEKVLWIKH